MHRTRNFLLLSNEKLIVINKWNRVVLELLLLMIFVLKREEWEDYLTKEKFKALNLIVVVVLLLLLLFVH